MFCILSLDDDGGLLRPIGEVVVAGAPVVVDPRLGELDNHSWERSWCVVQLVLPFPEMYEIMLW